MKNTLAFFIIIFSVQLYSQTIKNGIYYTVKKDVGFTSEIFEFDNNNKFNYSSFGCTGSGLGSGTYTIDNDSLHLKFDKIISYKHTDLNFINSKSDSLIINIKVGEKYSDYPLPNVKASFLESDIIFYSDFDGLLKVKILKFNSLKTLRLQFVGYGDYDILIDPEVSAIRGSVKMNNLFFYELGDVIKVKLKKVNTNKITFSYLNNLEINYRRISNQKAFEIFKENTDEDYNYFFN